MIQKPASILSEWFSRLKSNGYRLTSSCCTLVDIIATSSQALTAIELFDLGREKLPSLGLVTVYRTLEKLEQVGLIQRVHHQNGCHSFLRATQGHEHLVLCTRCGKASFFSGDDLLELFISVSQHTGFKIQDHWLQLWGLCSNCQSLTEVEAS